MARLRCAALTLAWFVLPGSAAAEWTELHTANFRVIGDAPARTIRETALRLEQFRSVLSRVSPDLASVSPVPTVVLVFANARTFAPYQPVYEGRRVADVAGYFQPSDTVNYIVMNAGVGDAAVRLVFHEYTHFLTLNTFGGTPAWFAEGLAQLYETVEMYEGGRVAIVGAALADHLQRLQEGPLLPLERLMRVTESLSVLHGGRGQGQFYSQSWALLHYLLLGNRERTPQLRAYADGLKRGDTPDAAFAAVFSADASAIEQELAGYVQQFRFTAGRFTFDDALTAERLPAGRRLPDAEAEAYLADLLARSGRTDEARTRLRALLDADPDNARAALSLGWLERRDSRLDVALPLLERAASLAPDDALAQGAFGAALYELAVRNASDRSTADAILRRAHAVLTQAMTLDPRSAPALVALSYAEVAVGGDDARAADLMRDAVALAPSRLEYRLGLAEALLRAGRRDEASELLRPLVTRTTSPDIAAQAAAMLAAIDGSAGAGPATGRRLALRLLQDGERRVLGRLTRMDCAGRVPRFHVETDAGVLRFDEVLGGAQLIAYERQSAQVACGAVPRAPRVLATFRASASGGDGLVVAIEMLPEGYEP